MSVKKPSKIVSLHIHDIRFPTSLELAGSDAVVRSLDNFFALY